MATTRKKLSRAKAQAVVDAIGTLLLDTDHDERLDLFHRVQLMDARNVCRDLASRLGKDEHR